MNTVVIPMLVFKAIAFTLITMIGAYKLDESKQYQTKETRVVAWITLIVGLLGIGLVIWLSIDILDRLPESI